MKILFCWVFVFCCLRLGEGLKTSKVTKKVINNVKSAAVDPVEIEWRKFKNTYKRQFKSLKEEGDRKNNFKIALDSINKHNAEFKAGKHSFSMGLNKYSDMSFAEFQQNNLGFQMNTQKKKFSKSFQLKNRYRGKPSYATPAPTKAPTKAPTPAPTKAQTKAPTSAPTKAPTSAPTKATTQAPTSPTTTPAPSYPESFTCDFVTPVKDQSRCGSCWAFAVTATLETSVSKLTKTKTSDFSEQQLLDCVSPKFNCTTGGSPYTAFVALINGTNTDESVYPYKAIKNLQCQIPIKKEGGYMEIDIMGDAVEFGDASTSLAKDMVPAVNEFCALVMVLGVHSSDFKYYKSGIYPGDLYCNQDGYYPNHAVTVVGYGVENGVKYWLVKNSWGTSWGDNGYFKIKRGENICKCENYYIAPIVKIL